MTCPTCGHDADPPAGLTPAERDLMRVIVELFDRDGTTPSYRAMMREMDMASPSSVQLVIGNLEWKGWIKRRGGSRNGGGGRRGLHILRRPPMPDFATPAFRLAAGG